MSKRSVKKTSVVTETWIPVKPVSRVQTMPGVEKDNSVVQMVLVQKIVTQIHHVTITAPVNSEKAVHVPTVTVNKMGVKKALSVSKRSVKKTSVVTAR